MINDNGICMLFERHAKIGRNKIFSTYGDVHSVSDLKCAIDELFLLVTVSIVINSSYCLEVTYLLNSLYSSPVSCGCFAFTFICCCCHLANKDVYYNITLNHNCIIILCTLYDKMYNKSEDWNINFENLWKYLAKQKSNITEPDAMIYVLWWNKAFQRWRLWKYEWTSTYTVFTRQWCRTDCESTCSAIYFRLLVEWTYAACGRSLDAPWRCVNFRSRRHALAALKFAAPTTSLCIMAAAITNSAKLLLELVVVYDQVTCLDGPDGVSSRVLNHLCSAKPRHHVMLPGVVVGPSPTTHHAACEIIQLSPVVDGARSTTQRLIDTRPYATITLCRLAPCSNFRLFKNMYLQVN